MSYEYEGAMVRVIDGDTVVLRLTRSYELAIDFGFYIKDTVAVRKSTEQTFRLTGINTPEVVGESRTAGLAAKAELERLLKLAAKPLRVVSYKGDKYGRWLCDVFVTDAAGTELHVNAALIAGGFAVPYMV